MNITQITVEPVTWKVHDHRLECGTEYALSCSVKAHRGEEATHFLMLRGPDKLRFAQIPICDICMNQRPLEELLGILGIKYRKEG